MIELPNDDMPARVIVGDSLTALKQMPDGCVHCAVTSPPYWALRDYGTGTWQGGSINCDHLGSNGHRIAESKASVSGGGHKAEASGPAPMKGTCKKCGAVRVDQQIGLEDTPEAYIARSQ